LIGADVNEQQRVPLLGSPLLRLNGDQLLLLLLLLAPCFPRPLRAGIILSAEFIRVIQTRLM
jgi:hypothetical protein